MLSILHLLAQYTPTCTTGIECCSITQNGIRYLYARIAPDANRHCALVWNLLKTYEKHNINNTVILYLPLYILYNFNTFKSFNIWHCTSQTHVLVLVLLCI